MWCLDDNYLAIVTKINITCVTHKLSSSTVIKLINKNSRLRVWVPCLRVVSRITVFFHVCYLQLEFPDVRISCLRVEIAAEKGKEEEKGEGNGEVESDGKFKESECEGERECKEQEEMEGKEKREGEGALLVGEFHTQWEQSVVDLDQGLDFTPRGRTLTSFTHLTHDDFHYV